MFAGAAVSVRTVWTKRVEASPLPADEFRAIVRGARAPAVVEFSGNTKLDGFIVRVLGTKMQVEANLFESPLLALRQFRPGEPAIAKLRSGMTEGTGILRGTVASFWRKLAGTSSYDGLSELIGRTYDSIRHNGGQPVDLEEIDRTAKLVDAFTKPELEL
ncbi:hypothetical protein C2U70_30910 [Bradyrhizobium guangdongense]|nr:hypothetical protein C2U70_30910 [Bradyrhizobium guangdongense]